MKVHVDLGSRGHDVHVGPGVRTRVGPLTADHTTALRALVVTQAPVAEHWLDDVVASLERAGLEVDTCTIADGEEHKDVTTLAQVWAACASIGLRRRDAIVALGGGVVGDLAGLAAATYNRGVALVHVPTTLLAQVDSSIGGKTGIDLEAGKNLVGAIHQPAVVVSDTETLTTLPDRVLREGFGEIVKHALLGDRELFDRLCDHPAALLDADADLADLVARNVAIKAAVVVADEHEQGERAHLNLGHTLGHALEVLVGYGTWWHGEAVAAGLLVALALGERLGLHGPEVRQDTTEVLGQLGLPTAVPPLELDAVHEVMSRDKKSDGDLRFVVLEEVGRPTIVKPDREDVDAAIAAVTDDAMQWPPPSTTRPAREEPT